MADPHGVAPGAGDEHHEHHEHHHPEGTAPFLPESWWGLSLLRRREIAFGLVIVAVLGLALVGYLVLGGSGSGEDASGTQEAAADTTPTTAPVAGATPSATVPDTDPSQYVASMSPQRVETFNSIAMCESSGDWSADTGNGFYGGLQFTLDSWELVGGSGNPADTSQDEQIMRGSLLQSHQGWVAWPRCAAQLGLT